MKFKTKTVLVVMWIIIGLISLVLLIKTTENWEMLDNIKSENIVTSIEIEKNKFIDEHYFLLEKNDKYNALVRENNVFFGIIVMMTNIMMTIYLGLIVNKLKNNVNEKNEGQKSTPTYKGENN